MSRTRRSISPEHAPSLPEPPAAEDGDYFAAALRLVHRDLDPTDLAILRLLRDDGRMATREIARRLGIAESQTRRRVSRLLDERHVYVTVLTEPASVGLLLSAMILINVQMDKADEVTAALAACPEVRYVAVVAGNYDLIVEACFYSRAHLAEFLTRRVAAMAGVISTSTNIVLKIAKLSYEWEIPDIGDRTETLAAGPAAARAP
jgi:Lrp/AsnC family transcriptional regulator for asnA, asnC and gidA